MGDRVAIMNEGRFEQVDTSQNIYNNPATRFVAQFIGKISLFAAWLEPAYSHSTQDSQLGIMVRPEDFPKLGRNDNRPNGLDRLPGTIVSHEFLGRTVLLEVQLGTGMQVNLALPNYQNSAGVLNPGRPVLLANGSFQAPPSSPRIGEQNIGPDGDAWANHEG